MNWGRLIFQAPASTIKIGRLSLWGFGIDAEGQDLGGRLWGAMMFHAGTISRRRKMKRQTAARGPRGRYHVRLGFESLESRRLLDAASWIAAGSGNWDAAANWSSGTVPASTTNVTINPATASTITILPGEADTVNSVTLGSNATLSLSSPDYTNPTSNLLTNSDFESPAVTNGTTTPASWNTWLNPAGTGQAYISTHYAYTGKQSFVVSGTNSGANQQIAATVGDSYTASIDAMTPGLTGNAQGYFDLYFYNSANAQVGGSSTNIFTSSSAAGGPLAGSVGALGWNHYYITAVAPANTSYAVAQISLWNPSGGGSVYFDDVELGPSATGGAATLTTGSVSNSGTILVGPANTLTVSGTLTQTATGVLDVGTTAAAGASALAAASVSNSGMVLIGPASTAAVSGALTQTSTGTFELGPAASSAPPRSRPPVFPIAARCSWDPRPRPRSAARSARLPRAHSTCNWAGPLPEITPSSTSPGPPRWPAR